MWTAIEAGPELHILWLVAVGSVLVFLVWEFTVKRDNMSESDAVRFRRALEDIAEGRGYCEGEEPWEVLKAREVLAAQSSAAFQPTKENEK